MIDTNIIYLFFFNRTFRLIIFEKKNTFIGAVTTKLYKYYYFNHWRKFFDCKRC